MEAGVTSQNSRLAAESLDSGSDPASFAASKLPELLAPAGDWECAKAAVENGADAIYFGLEKFNARMRAHNFTAADLPRLMEFLHSRGCKGYVTFNTLVFENELTEAEEQLRSIISAGVDAAIVQDVGICRLIRQLSPDFPIHVSTQMTITSAAGVEFARELGCDLVVLARECSLNEIEAILQSACGNLDSGIKSSPMPLEVFVHGALCVAYSGQCLTSEALGGRSANRGECAQACRMPYELISDGKAIPLADRRYLLSPQDLAGLDVLPELVRLGVASLKIEGRLKSPEYVANITRVYRRALDDLAGEIISNNPRTMPSPKKAANGKSCDDRSQYEMEMAFSRGLYTGWFRGTNNQELVHGRFGKKRGVYIGEVVRVQGDRVIITARAPLKAGDGVVFDAGHPEEAEEGGRIYAIRPGSKSHAAELQITFGRDDVNFHRVHPGDKVWKTSDPALEAELRKSFEADTPRFRRPISVAAHGALGKLLTLIVQDECGNVVQVKSAIHLTSAQNQPLTPERLRQQLGRLGGTGFELGGLQSFVEPGLILPVSELNRLRRDAIRQLEQLRARPKRWQLNPRAFAAEREDSDGPSKADTPVRPAEIKGISSVGFRRDVRQDCPGYELIVLIRRPDQLEAALQSGIRMLYCEFEDPKKYREAVASVRAVSDSRRPEIFVAPPRIFKTGEEWTLRQVHSAEADGYLVRNYDHLKFFGADRCIGDFSLNIANHLSAEYFKNRSNLERVTASYDLNFSQLEALLQRAPPEWFEITIHQHMPMFHMEHCVFCAFLSSGTDYRNCGRPCDRHDLKLRDRVGAEHPVKADVGCRNTVFNALAQTGAEYVERMLALGLRNFRLEFLNETAEQVASTIAKYQQLFNGEITGQQLWRELKLFNQLGVTRGPMSGG